MHRYWLLILGHKRISAALISIVIIIVIIITLVVGQPKKQNVYDFNSCITAGNDVINTDPPTCSSGHTTYAQKIDNPSAVSTPSLIQLQYKILVSGDSRGTYPKSEKVISNLGDWTAYWRSVNNQIKPTPPILAVDFKTEQVIAITAGEVPNSGYSVEVTGVSVDQTTTYVYYDIIIPATTCSPKPGLSDPYYLISTTKSPANFKFIPTNKSKKC